MVKVIEGALKAENFKFGIAVSRFNELITSRLLDGAIDALIRHGADTVDIEVAWSPGAFELPQVADKLIARNRYDAIIILGAVIRGATPHFEYIAAEVSKGISHLALRGALPITFGVLTTDTIEQAVERAGTKAGNKGFEAAVSAIEMVNLVRELEIRE